MLEKELEKYLKDRIEIDLKGLCRKYKSSVRGVPDRMCIVPGGQVFFVELKTQKGRLSELQKHEITKIVNLNVDVYIVRSKGDVDSIVKDYKSDISFDKEDDVLVLKGYDDKNGFTGELEK